MLNIRIFDLIRTFEEKIPILIEKVKKLLLFTKQKVVWKDNFRKSRVHVRTLYLYGNPVIYKEDKRGVRGVKKREIEKPKEGRTLETGVRGPGILR